MNRRLVEPLEKIREVVIFHDASSSTAVVLIYLVTEGEERRMKIVKAGSKCENAFIPCLQHCSRSYALTMIQPMLGVLRKYTDGNLSLTFLSDSICSLKLLKDDLESTNKVVSNTKLQLEHLGLLSEMFFEGRVKCSWYHQNSMWLTE